MLDNIGYFTDCENLTVANFIYANSEDSKMLAALAKTKCIAIKLPEFLSCRGKSHDEIYTPNQEEIKEEVLREDKEDEIMTALEQFALAVISAATKRLPLILLNASYKTADHIAALMTKKTCRQVYWYKKGAPENNFNKVAGHTGNVFIKNFSSKAVIDSVAGISNGLDITNDLIFISKISSIGLDVSMSNTGVAVLANFNSRNLILAGSFGSDSKLDDFTRGLAAKNYLRLLSLKDMAGNEYLADVTKSAHIAIEGGALGAAHGAYRLGRYCGMVMSNFKISSILEIAPTRLKKIITGYGFAEKAAVKKFALYKLGLTGGEFLNEDESDALALLYCKINESGLEFTVSKKRTKKKPPKKAAVK